MPIYEFQCTDCGEDFEKLVKISKIDEVVCDKCGSPQVAKKLSTFATKGSTSSNVNTGATCAPGGT